MGDVRHKEHATQSASRPIDSYGLLGEGRELSCGQGAETGIGDSGCKTWQEAASKQRGGVGDRLDEDFRAGNDHR